MKLIGGKLYLEFKEAVEAGMNEGYLWKAKSEGIKCWDFMNDPDDKRKVLIGYDGLKDMYKKMVLARYGNPYVHVARQPILDMIVMDFRAEQYYMQYRYCGVDMITKQLPIAAVDKYVRAASWLNLVRSVMDDKSATKRVLGIGIGDFFEHAAALIALEKQRGKVDGWEGKDVLPGEFPSTYQRLVTKMREYVAGGYDTLISHMYGNTNSAKIGKLPAAQRGGGTKQVDSGTVRLLDGPTPTLTAGQGIVRMGITAMQVAGGMGLMPVNSAVEAVKSGENAPVVHKKSVNEGGFCSNLKAEQMAVIRYWMELPQNLDAEQIRQKVNLIFANNGWETLSVATIKRLIKENRHLITAARRGPKAHANGIARQIKRRATEYPLAYWTLDGWTAELMYQERGAKGVAYKRLVVVVVLDACGKYPVGWAIGERETAELIKEANRNALLHVEELFGGRYRPWQMQSDRYQIKHLTPFYQAVTQLHTPARVGNAKAKIIEPYFKHLNKTYCQQTPNWTGFNVTASKKNQVNIEALDKTKHMSPDRAGVERQINAMLRAEQGKKISAFMRAWDAASDENKTMIGDVEWLMVFGKPVGKTNVITGKGIEKQIENVKYTYDSFDPLFRSNMHLNWQIIADLTDMRKVLAVSPDEQIRVVLEEVMTVAMDIRSTTPEEREYRAKVEAYNKEQELRLAALYEHDAEVTRDVVSRLPMDMTRDEAFAMKTMLTIKGQQKELLQDAKRLDTAEAVEVEDGAAWNAKQAAYLNSVADFSVYE